MSIEYASAICEFCPWTNYGEYSSSYHSPNGCVSCESQCCPQAYDNYVEDTGDNTPMEELF